jgi:anti-sigma regulatory factor (Ser/Thr protein kinase)/GAF domain-containing protein
MEPTTGQAANDARHRHAGPFESFLSQRSAALGRRVSGVAFLAILALVGVAIALAWRQYTHGQASAANELRSRAVVAAAVVNAAFAGDLNSLSDIAAAPAVVNGDYAAMRAYFRRVQPPGRPPFTGGLGWIDRRGLSQVSSTQPTRSAPVDVSDRTYVKRVLATGKPYVSAGLIARRAAVPVVVVAVPTFDAKGRISGVLAGGIRVKAVSANRTTLDLGYAGLAIVDRDGQLLFDGLKRVPNATLLARLGRSENGVARGVKGLDGTGNDVVAFAAASVPAWKVAIDQPASTVYAAARRALVFEVGAIVAAAVTVLAILGFALTRSRRAVSVADSRARAWSGLTRSIATASTAEEVSAALLISLGDAYPTGLPVVGIEAERLRVQSLDVRAWRRVTANDDTVSRIATFATDGRRSGSVEHDPSLRKAFTLSGRRLRSIHGIPITTPGGDPAGTITVLLTEPGELPGREWLLLESFAEQAGQALARTYAFEREHELAVSLQRSLLPDQLPEIDGLDLAGHYRAGGAGLEVGGDWYDALRRPDGIVHLSVGDVIGRGIGAATLMGRHRSTFRAYAYECRSPAEILRRMTRHVDSDEMIITLACVTIDPYTAELTYCCAGHPPPLLVDSETGEVTRLASASSPPLGVAEPHDFVEAELELPPRATLALYTDGLIERRGQNIDDGIDVLGTFLSENDRISVDSVLQSVGEVLGPTTDDTALLLVRPTGVPAELAIEVEARPDELPLLRRRLKLWLAQRGVDDDEASDIVLAVNEACNNAIEHAYLGREGVVALTVVEAAGLLHVTVSDSGSWRDDTPSGELRGRGIPIMRSLMTEAEIETGANGTNVRLERRLTSKASSEV